MNEFTLISRQQSSGLLADLLLAWSETTLTLAVREDTAFRGNGWLDIGSIILKPGAAEPNTDNRSTLASAIQFGFYEWRCPSEENLSSALFDLTGLSQNDEGKKNDDSKKDQRSKALRSLDALAAAACRVGLIHPIFDPNAVSLMPFRRPTTVVSDTSAIIQGGLDFVVRFLYPMARIKVPAIAHMELLNASDRFLILYRKQSQSAGTVLLDHTMSQGGQRALLRLELQTETEIERGRLGADPLRGVVHPGSDHEDKALGLSVIQRSFADRLIFETARQHVRESSPDHPVSILTCDQGLARMTMAEGMPLLYFDALKFSSMCGRLITGTSFNPFTGKLYAVPLSSLLWELSVTYGAARLTTKGGDSVEIVAMGTDLSWKPHHADDDLLRVRTGKAMPIIRGPSITPQPKRSGRSGQQDHAEGAPKLSRPVGFYRFSLSKMLVLIEQIVEKETIPEAKALELIDSTSKSQIADYGGFLLAGGFIADEAGSFLKAESTDELWRALRMSKLASLGELFQRVPSFSLFIKTIEATEPGEQARIPERSRSAYTSLAEIAGLAMHIPDDRIYRTANNPLPSSFADLAWRAYAELSHGTDEFVLTGAWLEELGRHHGVHPLVARDRLQEARTSGLLERYTEGSTPETRYSRHTLDTLVVSDGVPRVRRIGLYEGDLLLPGKGSVSLKLRKAGQ